VCFQADILLHISIDVKSRGVCTCLGDVEAIILRRNTAYQGMDQGHERGGRGVPASSWIE